MIPVLPLLHGDSKQKEQIFFLVGLAMKDYVVFVTGGSINSIIKAKLALNNINTADVILHQPLQCNIRDIPLKSRVIQVDQLD